LGLNFLQDLLTQLKRLKGNNVATSKLRSRVEAAAEVGHIFHESTFVEVLTGAVSPRDFHGNIVYSNAFFSSPLTADHFRQPAYFLFLTISYVMHKYSYNGFN
jgi:hypothetical protein